MSDLDRALELLLAHEGGWSNHRNDKGGATMYGITQATWNLWCREHNLTKSPVKSITKEQAREVYEEWYWNLPGCNKLPWPFSYLLFDAAINSGPGRGIDWLQEGLGVPVDSGRAASKRVGPQTVAAAQKAVADGNARAVKKAVEARARFLANLVQSKPGQVDFAEGWWVRTLDVQARSIVDLVNA